MKISFDIECTPVEARTFLGLPDVTPLHQVYLDKMSGLMTDGIGAADVERMMRLWMPGFGEGLEQWRQAMFATLRQKSD